MNIDLFSQNGECTHSDCCTLKGLPEDGCQLIQQDINDYVTTNYIKLIGITKGKLRRWNVSIEAEDVIHDLLLKLRSIKKWKKWSYITFKETVNLDSYVYPIIEQIILSLAKGMQPFGTSNNFLVESDVSRSQESIKDMDYHTYRTLILKVIKTKMSNGTLKSVAKKHFLEYESHVAIAHQLNIKVSTSHKYVAISKKILAKELTLLSGGNKLDKNSRS